MSICVTPFTDDHLDAAAVLLAARQDHLRTTLPELPIRYTDPAAARLVVEAARTGPPAVGPGSIAPPQSVDGVVALRGGRMVGYLLGFVWVETQFRHGRVGGVDLGGHAAEPEDADAHHAMYAALLPRWLAQGCLAHYVNVAADDAPALRAWSSLGFGREHTRALRETTPPSVPRGDGFTLRQATPADHGTVLAFEQGLAEHHAQPPILTPLLPESVAGYPDSITRQLADEAVTVWLAEQHGTPLAMQSFEPERPTNPLITPERSIHLARGFTALAARGTRAGGALLHHALAWARSVGHDHCTISWYSANIPAARFWQESGFRPTQHRLLRVVDDRILWAKERV